jgi:hypothetical protein
MSKPMNRIGVYPNNPVEVVNLKPDDVIILHLTEDVDFECANTLVKDMQKTFPNNTIICRHPSLIENITFVKKEENKINFEQPFLSYSWE